MLRYVSVGSRSSCNAVGPFYKSVALVGHCSHFRAAAVYKHLLSSFTLNCAAGSCRIVERENIRYSSEFRKHAYIVRNRVVGSRRS